MTHSTSLIVFWSSIVFLAYTFAGYPLLLAFVSLFHRRRTQRQDIVPTVTLIVPAHNEAKIIKSKIENCLQLDYPREKLEMIVASDASQDETNDIVRAFAGRGVRLLETQERKGKHYVQMLARDSSVGEILVFTDAGVQLPPDSIHRIVSNFADPSVGCVSSEDEVVGQSKGQGEGVYVRVEMWLRRLEAEVGSLVGNSGSFFAARREVCDMPWHPSQSSDFFLALHAIERGQRAVVDQSCRAQYGLVRSEKAEFRRKVRTIVHGIDVLFLHLKLMNPFRYGFPAWQIVSHKLFRWLVPFAMLFLLVSNAMLYRSNSFYAVLFALQLAAYGGGLLAMAMRQVAKFKPFKLVAFLLMANAATITAWLEFCAGERYAAWEPSRRN